jgi:Ca2+-binding EF-hand superfamily protein
MKSKTLILSALTTLAFVSPIFAEGKEDRKGKGIPEEKRAELLEKFDTDKDGKLDEEERKAARAAFKEEFMKKFDTNGDGEISDEEREEAKKKRKEMILERFDEDGDGELSEEERKKARAAFHERMKGKKCPGKGKGKGKKDDEEGEGKTL